jgi:hypothetical protein
MKQMLTATVLSNTDRCSATVSHWAGMGGAIEPGVELDEAMDPRAS